MTLISHRAAILFNRNKADANKIGNMKTVWVNQTGTYTFSLQPGNMAVVITYRGVYPHYSSSAMITANQLISKDENVITSVNNANHTVSVYNKDSTQATQAVIIMPC